MQVQAWPDLEEWLDEYSEEIPSPIPLSQIESFTLPEKELKKFIEPEFNTIYTIKNAQLFSKFFLAAYRHDGFAPIFTPLNIKHYELTRTIHLGESLHYPQVRKRMGVGAWAFCIGCYSVCEEDDSVIFISHDAKLKAKIKEILQNIATSTQDIELNIEKPIRTDHIDCRDVE